MIKFKLESESSHSSSSSSSSSHSRAKTRRSKSKSSKSLSLSHSESSSDLDSCESDSEVETDIFPSKAPDKGRIIKSIEQVKSYSTSSLSSFYQDQNTKGEKEEDDDDEEGEGEGEERLAKLEKKFAKLGFKFRRAMNLYGLAQDVTLLLNQKFWLINVPSHNTNENNGNDGNFSREFIKTRANNRGLVSQENINRSKKVRKFLSKLISFSLVLLANLTGIYVLVSHFIWEFKVLDAKSNSYSELVKESASSKGWSVLKEFLENLRRHLSRIFAVSLTLTWHLNCHNIEMIFVDCANYYSMFYKNYLKQEDFNLLRVRRKQLLKIGENFYEFSKRRVNWSIWLPLIHFCINVCSISLFPSSNKRRTSDSIKKILVGSIQNGSVATVSLLDQILDNFDSFHLSIHTAFHPYDYNISRSKPEFFGGMKMKQSIQKQPQQQQPLVQNLPLHATVTPFESAIYCLLELLIYSFYYHGPRIICATCLAIVMNIHYQCITFFNCQLQACIKRPKEKPLTSLDIINLLKQYDLIGRMHEKIEQTFKWSIVQWYGLMFISCLMHIFAFTESTSAYVVNQQRLHAMAANAAAAVRGASSGNMRPQQQQQTTNNYLNYTIPGNWTQQSLSASGIVGVGPNVSNGNGNNSDSYYTSSNNNSSTSFTIMFVRLASVFFVCYSPYLIYCEAFKIEAASNRTEQSIQKLVRRQDDPLAQAIEPSLFEPNYLSVGDYFHINKKSMSSLLGAIVTFSVMFIAANEPGRRDHWKNRGTDTTYTATTTRTTPEEVDGKDVNENDDSNGSDGDDDGNEGEEEEEEDNESEEIDTTFTSQDIRRDHFPKVGVARHHGTQSNNTSGGHSTGLTGVNHSGGSKFTANSINLNTQVEPSEYDIPLDDDEKALSNVDEDNNNNKTSGLNDEMIEVDATSVASSRLKDLAQVNTEEGRQKGEESGQDGGEEDDDADDDGEDHDQVEESGQDEEEDEVGKEAPNEQVRGEEEGEMELELDGAGFEEEKDGRSRQPVSVLGAQNLSGSWLAGSTSGSELKVKLAGKADNKEERGDGGQVAWRRPLVLPSRRRGEEQGKKAKRVGEQNNKKHENKIKGISKPASYLGEVTGREEYDTNEVAAYIKSAHKSNNHNNFQNGALTPLLESQYIGRVRENERSVDLVPELRILNQVEVCDIELFTLSSFSSSSKNDNRDHHHIDYLNKNRKYIMNSDRKLNSKAKLAPSSLSSTNNVEDKQEKKEEDKHEQRLPFIVSWINRINGEATLEAKSELLMNCERERNYTFKMRAIGCNGLHSNDALVSVTLVDTNEFSPEFERQLYSMTLDLDLEHVRSQDLSSSMLDQEEALLLQVQARDQDCSSEYGSICRYELLAEPSHKQQSSLESADLMSSLAVDSSGRVKIRRHFLAKAASTGYFLAKVWNWHYNTDQQASRENPANKSSPFPFFSFQVIAYDCGGKKSLAPATIRLHLNKLCRPTLKDVDTQIAYKPQSGDRLPFLRARLDLCGAKCHRPNISVALRLEATPKFAGLHKTAGNSDNKNSRGRRKRKKRVSFVTLKAEHGKGAGEEEDDDTISTWRRTKNGGASGGSFHCDRESYSMISKRRLCGARNKRAIELLPPYNVHNKWILPLHRQLLEISINEPSSNLQQQQQQQLDFPDKLSEVVSNKNESFNSENSDSDKDYENELNGELDNNLNAYSLHGAYGRQATEFFTSRSANELAQGEPESGGRTPSARKLEAGRVNQRPKHIWKRQRRLNARSGSGRVPRRADGRKEAIEQSQLNNQGVNANGQVKSSTGNLFDWNSIYRDQVYRFDGLSRAVVVPQSIYSNKDTLNKSHNNGSSMTTTPPEMVQAKQFIFGSKHTISFWMRHAPFKFQPPTNEMLLVEMNSNNSLSSNGQEKFQQAASMNITSDDLDELAKHVKEHLICGSLDSSDGSQARHTLNQFDSTKQQQFHKHHHYYYALFVRNCKLVLLMRRQVNESRLNDAKNYLPTEWRWSLDQAQANTFENNGKINNKVCDNKWHLYTINVNYPTVELYVDGQQFEENYNNLVIVDDLPINIKKHHNSSVDYVDSTYNVRHSKHDVQKTLDFSDIVLSIGACWDRHHKSWNGHFRGSLSGLSVLANENDDSNTIECLGRCSEELVSTANSGNSLLMHDQEAALTTDSSFSNSNKLPNSLISYQESQSKILLNGHDFIDVEDALSQIAYTNNRLLPSIGKRSIVVDTNVECQSQQQQQSSSPQISTTFSIPIEQVKVEVSIFPSKNLPVILLSGITNMAREYTPFMNGINLFSSIKIYIRQLNLKSTQHISLTNKSSEPFVNKSQPDQDHFDSTKSQYVDYIEDPNSNNQLMDESIELSNTKRRIEACIISIDPPLNKPYESLLLPIDKLNNLELYWRQSQNGAIIYGVDSVERYQHLLRSIVYKNQKPAYYSERQFKLVCSDMNGRLVSNEYIQTLSIIHLTKQPLEGNEQETFSKPASQISDMNLKFSNLRISNLPSERPSPPVDKFINLKQQQQQQAALNLLNLEQTTRLDRIAIAFLVFVVSLIVIMIIIALTNLKEPGLKNCSFENSHGSRTNKQLIYDSDQALSYDIDSQTQSRYYYGDELMMDEIDDSEDEEEDEEDIEEEDYDKSNRPDSRLSLKNDQKRSQVKLRKILTNELSTTNTDLESLAWDDEALNDDDDYTIVMNPIIHGIKLKNANYIRSTDAQGEIVPRTSVTEQRPNKSGSMTQKPQTHLSYHSPILTGACSLPNKPVDQDEEDAESSFSETGEVRILSRDGHELPVNSAGSSSGSSSSSSSSSSSCSSDEELTITTCEHHHYHHHDDEQEDDDDDDEVSSSSDQYELYHAHQHHFHHTCLKRLHYESSQDSDVTNASETSGGEEFEEAGEGKRGGESKAVVKNASQPKDRPSLERGRICNNSAEDLSNTNDEISWGSSRNYISSVPSLTAALTMGSLSSEQSVESLASPL